LFLQENLPEWTLRYDGYDTSEKLLEIAHKDTVKNAEIVGIKNFEYNFTKLDVIANPSAVKGTYDLVVAFGLMHHIPSRELRETWLNSIFGLVDNPGICVLTFWNYTQDRRSENAVRSINTPDFEIHEGDLDDGDYFLGWDKKQIYRYVHEYTEKDLIKVQNSAKQAGLELIETYDSDGRSKNLNKYYIFSK
jgi:tRNA (uracil-5-)-methyltransferase TRM9